MICYLIALQGVTKDIQQLFTAIDRRVEALRRNVQHSRNETQKEVTAPVNSSFDEDDKESFLDEHNSSPDSSPDTHTSRLRHPISISEQSVTVPIPDQPVSNPEQRQSSSSPALSGESDNSKDKSQEKESQARQSPNSASSVAGSDPVQDT